MRIAFTSASASTPAQQVARVQGARVGTCFPVIAEMLAGIECSQTRTPNLLLLNKSLKLYPVWPFDEAAAREYARLFAQTRQSGRTVHTMDLMVAAIALTMKCVLVTLDSDFQAIPQLRCENWRT